MLFALNGAPVAVEPRAGETLLETLRVRRGARSVKDGCQPQGQCGCCLVLIDGLPKVSCATQTAAIAGHEITTLEGIAAEEQRLMARCFVATAGLQRRTNDQRGGDGRRRSARSASHHEAKGGLKSNDHSLRRLNAASIGPANPFNARTGEEAGLGLGSLARARVRKKSLPSKR